MGLDKEAYSRSLRTQREGRRDKRKEVKCVDLDLDRSVGGCAGIDLRTKLYGTDGPLLLVEKLSGGEHWLSQPAISFVIGVGGRRQQEYRVKGAYNHSGVTRRLVREKWEQEPPWERLTREGKNLSSASTCLKNGGWSWWAICVGFVRKKCLRSERR